MWQRQTRVSPPAVAPPRQRQLHRPVPTRVVMLGVAWVVMLGMVLRWRGHRCLRPALEVCERPRCGFGPSPHPLSLHAARARIVFSHPIRHTRQPSTLCDEV